VLLLHRPWLLATSADLAARYGLHGYLLEKVPRIFTQSLRPALIHFAAFAALTLAWLCLPPRKSEIRNPKHETNSNDRNSNDRNRGATAEMRKREAPFWSLGFDVLNLLRISCFEFRVWLRLRRVRHYALPAILITLADLLTFAWHLNPTVSPAVYETPPAAARFLLAQERSTPPPRLYRWNVREVWSLDASRGRYDPFSQGWANHPERFNSCAESLAPSVGMLWRIPVVEGFGITSLQAYNEMLGVGHKRDAFMPYDLTPALADLLNVGYVLTTRTLPERDLALNLPDLDLRLYHNPDYLPRAFLVHDWKALPSRPAILAELHSGRFNPRQYALLTAAEAASLTIYPPLHYSIAPAILYQHEPPVAIRRYASDEVLMTTDARAEALLVLGDVHYPGWRAWLDGRRQPILRANYALRGLPAPPGPHAHHLVYDPRSFKLGAALSLIALAAIVVLVSVRSRSAPHASRPTEYALRTTHYGPILLCALAVAALILILSAVLIPEPWRQLPQRLTVNFYLGCECDANGRQFYREGKLDEAIRELRIVTAVLPGDPAGYYNLGGMYLAKGDNERAAQEWQKALAIKPNHQKALEALQRLRGR
ncbi:MAG: tetratricopeptide repeat protein, partial [Planctomycetes bacterium]|nr:tetratricopeptide repeat protein [Planctomycetota bacterium]